MYFTSVVAREVSGIERTDPNILIDNNCMDDKTHFAMPGSLEDHYNVGDKIE